MGLPEINSRSGARLLGAKHFASEVSLVNQDHYRHRYTPENVVYARSLRLRLTLLNVAVAFKSISKSNFELLAVGTASDASQT
jgi:hypothetical protein